MVKGGAVAQVGGVTQEREVVCIMQGKGAKGGSSLHHPREGGFLGGKRGRQLRALGAAKAAGWAAMSAVSWVHTCHRAPVAALGCGLLPAPPKQQVTKPKLVYGQAGKDVRCAGERSTRRRRRKTGLAAAAAQAALQPRAVSECVCFAGSAPHLRCDE